ncbi:MAG: murein biosynthesis integral membrane protein MurJ [Labilithrix sp.]|nr:murein biosynthesis integral membrane protein MurJ [Labilithrix sp.]
MTRSLAPDDTEKEKGSERALLVSRAGVVGAGTLLSRAFGLGRDVTIAALFDRAQTDAFWIAFAIPNALRQLLAEGAVTSAVVPILTGKLATRGDAAAKAFFARARAVSLLALSIVTVLGVAFAGPLTETFAGGYHATPGKFERTRELTRVVFPYVFFMGTAAMGMAALNAKRRFAVAAFAPGLLNVAIVAAAIALRTPLEARGVDGVIALGVGVLAGGALQVAAQLPSLRALGFLGRPVLDLRDPGVRDMLRRIGPMTFGLGIYYVDLVISRRLLSDLGDGAQSYFSWATRVCDLPQGIFVMAISTATLPSLATLAAKGDLEELGKTYADGMRLAMFVAIPASVALVVLGEPIVALLFERGRFDAVATRETARALVWQGGAIFTVAAVRQLVPTLYALGDTRTPVIVSAIDSVVFVAMAWGLRRPFGHVGVSMAIGGSTLVQMALLAYAVRRRIGTLRAREIGAASARTFASAAVAAAGAWCAVRAARGLASGGGAEPTSLPGLAAGVVFVGLFVAAARALGSRELGELAAPLRRRREPSPRALAT